MGAADRKLGGGFSNVDRTVNGKHAQVDEVVRERAKMICQFNSLLLYSTII
jgi:hypothetical protein